MESAVACRPAPDQGADVFTNTAPLFRPLWGRGAFGGAVLAQALSAAQATVPAGFVVDTMHCHFFVAVRSDAPLYSHVERLRDGRSIATRSVRAVQSGGGGTCVFAAMLSFGRAEGRGPRMLEHQPESPLSAGRIAEIVRGAARSPTSQVDAACPFESVRVRAAADDGRKRHELQRIVQLTRGKVAEGVAGREELGEDGARNLAALAYMTDNFFLGAVPRVHKAYRFNNAKFVGKVVGGMHEGQREAATERFKVLAREEVDDAEMRRKAGAETAMEASRGGIPSNVDMMVSLDHTIFFHNQDKLKAGDWLVMEMETPWAGQDRGLVLERIWTSDGVLVATCIQEGLMRISQDPEAHL